MSGRPPRQSTSQRAGSPPAAGPRRHPSSRKMRCWAFACAALLITLNGCTSWSEYFHNGFKVGPNYRKPSAPVERNWIEANDVRVRSASDDLSRWWSVFNDPVLDGLIADSYRQSLTLRQAAFRVLQARAILGTAVGSLFPQTQQLTGDHTENAISKETANRSFVSRRFYGQWDFGTTLSWELDFWGRLRRAIIAANDNLDASVENYDDVLVTLLGDVANDYAQIRILQAEIAYTKANADLQRSILTLVKARFDGGQVTELDVDQAQSVLSQTESQIPALEITLRQTEQCALRAVGHCAPGPGRPHRRGPHTRRAAGSGHRRASRSAAPPAGRAHGRALGRRPVRADRHRRGSILPDLIPERDDRLLGRGFQPVVQPARAASDRGTGLSVERLELRPHSQQRAGARPRCSNSSSRSISTRLSPPPRRWRTD